MIFSTQTKNDHWLNEHELPSNPHYHWLTGPYVLSDAIQRVSQQPFSVKVLAQGFSLLENDEYAVHEAPIAYLREVFLLAGGEPWVYARVSVSTRCRFFLEELSALGDRPIGVNLLYNNKDIERSAFQFRLYENLRLGESRQHPGFWGQPVWARRSTFTDQKTQLLVSEYFSSTISPYCN